MSLWEPKHDENEEGVDTEMRLKRELLEKIIREELELFYEVNPAHKGKGPGGGRFAKKGQGKTYSLTKNAEDDVAEDSELEVPARGSITSQGKISSKFGMNTGAPDKQCGRLEIGGSPKKKTRRCADYPKKYWTEEIEEELAQKRTRRKQPTLSTADDAYIKAVIKQELATALKQVQQKGAGGRGCSWDEIMTALMDIETAQKGRKDNGK